MVMPGRRRRPVIAVVDDDRRVLESLESLLNSADYDVRLYATATELLETGGLQEIDGLISDVAMPGIDGFELARAVRAARPGLPVILVTGRPELLRRSPLDGPGDSRVFKKPFDGQELLTAVAHMLETTPPE